jgi:D-tyrosyl-tRNA(Tyr) deacylase
MKAVIQRVKRASVSIDDEKQAEIGKGFLILLGVKKGDGLKEAEDLASDTAHLRTMEDDSGKMNLSLLKSKGEALVVPQFTLLADTSKGRRPSFVKAESPKRAKKLYEKYVYFLKNEGVKTKTGVFGANMDVSLINTESK